ncbi:hypothetical protein PR202_gb21181 [Eleusine coracana subsp. coracana]|uniref:F-box domain-containing protein n=1 Tax=Eleusine coracana subsp. coracana TaxID=191504 RepID=A0AAV5FCG1_ELECO|nr:hypothetical protein PR202_gb21181 [Eleusine coracana subsp. coracana]
MASPAPLTLPRPKIEATALPRMLASLTDDLLQEIFIRIGTPADLDRASAACASFRRLITDPSFLRRYHSRHPPLLMGIVTLGLHIVEEPHPNAAVARSLAGAADFSFRFVPHVKGNHCHWPLDVCDGRFLLRCNCARCHWCRVVCDPLSRRYLVLPPVALDLLPEALRVSVKVRESPIETLLVPSGDCEKKSITVIAWMQSDREAALLLYSSVTGRWSFGTSTTWDALGLKVPPEGLRLMFPCYAYGCFYWEVESSNKWLKFNVNRMEFSTLDYPPDQDARDVVTVEAGEGRIGVFAHNEQEASLHYLIRQNKGKNANDWQLEKIIPLPADDDYYLAGAGQGPPKLLNRPLKPSISIRCLSPESSWLGGDAVICLSGPPGPRCNAAAGPLRRPLEEIFLRIASPADLTRASAACVTFYRLVTDPSFLRRYRSLHPPLFLGVFGRIAGFQPAKPPHPSAHVARNFAGAANFNFHNYLPRARGRGWFPTDVRDGRVLLESINFDNLMDTELVVCDPLSRQYRLLPPVPIPVQMREQNELHFEFEAFLIPSGDKDEETTFRVIFQAYYVENIVTSVFSSDSGSWSIGTSTGWGDSGLPDRSMQSLGGRQYAYGWSSTGKWIG